MLGDSRDVLAGMSDACVDLCLTDPPYNIGHSTSKLCKIGDKIVTNREMLGDFDAEEDHLEVIEAVFREVRRVLKPGGSLISFYDLNEITRFKDMLVEMGFYCHNFFFIEKINPVPHFRKNGYRSAIEEAIHITNGMIDEEAVWLTKDQKEPSSFNFLTQTEMKNKWEYVIGQKHTEHPTEKPVPILRQWIRAHSNPGDVVLDPFAGSGSTLIAAHLEKRKWVGIEKRQDFYQMAQEWIGRCMEQPELEFGI